MWLTRILCGIHPVTKKHRLYRRKYSGKHRIPVEPSDKTKIQLLKRLAYEEEVMFYLKHPYLTEQQEHGHSAALNKMPYLERLKLIKPPKMLEHVKMEDRLAFLKHTEAWE